MPTPLIDNHRPFIGRKDEQDRFREALRDLLASDDDAAAPYIFLLYGDGGIGKTTLARRYEKILQEEVEFEGEFSYFWLDWEAERDRDPRLQVHEQVTAETLYDVIHRAAIRVERGWQFKEYQRVVKLRQEAEHEAAKAMTGFGEGDQFAVLRGVSAETLAGIVRTSIPAIGPTGERVVQAFLDIGIKVSAEQAAVLRADISNKLKARLKPDQLHIFLSPEEQLGRALGKDLHQAARKKPVVLFLDTYEVADRADAWLRIVQQAAGGRVCWVIGGRNDLAQSREYDGHYFRGYAEEYATGRLRALDLRRLAQQEIQDYFTAVVPGRPLGPDEIKAISQATRGIPLAMRMAAEMWAGGASLTAVIGDAGTILPGKQIVQGMAARYFLHAVGAHRSDRDALYAMALAEGDRDLLSAMLSAGSPEPFDLQRRLDDLERRYASVFMDECRLHDEPAFFLLADLRRQPETARKLSQCAVGVLQTRLEKCQSYCPRLEDCCQDDEWVTTALRLTEMLFWQDEEAAWKFLIPHFVAGLAYSTDLLRGLLNTARKREKELSLRGKARLKKLAVKTAWQATAEEEAALIDELEQLARLGWLEGGQAAERRAILALERAQWLRRAGRGPEALAALWQVEAGLPADGQVLPLRLAKAQKEFAQKLLWPGRDDEAVPSPEAETLLDKAALVLTDDANAWYYLGVARKQNGHLDLAVTAYQRAIALDPKDANSHNGLGNVYRLQTRYKEAIAAYQRAIELDPKFAPPHNSLGNVYRNQSRYEEAIAAYQRAIELDPKDATPHHGLGILYSQLGQLDLALAAYQEAVNLNPKDGAFQSSLVGILRRLGREAEALEHERIARSLISAENEYNQACFAAICGQTEEALQLLKTALEKQQTSLDWARQDPDLESLHNDDRFWALVGGRSGAG